MMIVRETEHEYFMTAQHDHANFSGLVAQHFSEDIVKKNNPYHQDFILGVMEHDRSWIRLDETPIWNDHTKAPFSFMDFPLLPKLTMYQYGLDEIEKMSKYACLLCSMHYSSFFHNVSREECAIFYKQEIVRQNRIKEQINMHDEELINLHFRLLQFCDDFSLYACLNEPGASKEDEFPWYKNGFSRSEFLSSDGNLLLSEWKSLDKIVISRNLFESDLSISLRQKRVPKELISQIGIGAAYKQTDYSYLKVMICK